MKPRSRKASSAAEKLKVDDAVRAEIARRAYERFEHRGWVHGYHEQVLSRLNAGSDKKVRPLVPRPRARRKKTSENQA
jgi:hypothetical protein